MQLDQAGDNNTQKAAASNHGASERLLHCVDGNEGGKLTTTVYELGKTGDDWLAFRSWQPRFGADPDAGDATYMVNLPDGMYVDQVHDDEHTVFRSFGDTDGKPGFPKGSAKYNEVVDIENKIDFFNCSEK